MVCQHTQCGLSATLTYVTTTCLWSPCLQEASWMDTSNMSVLQCDVSLKSGPLPQCYHPPSPALTWWPDQTRIYYGYFITSPAALMQDPSTKNKQTAGQWCHMPLIPALRRQTHVDFWVQGHSGLRRVPGQPSFSSKGNHQKWKADENVFKWGGHSWVRSWPEVITSGLPFSIRLFFNLFSPST